jgi:hypothetical protein
MVGKQAKNGLTLIIMPTKEEKIKSNIYKQKLVSLK